MLFEVNLDRARFTISAIDPPALLSLCIDYGLVMESIGDRWYQVINQTFARQPDDVHGISVVLWERLTSELVSIIGTGGFQSIYTRSVHLTSASFPWITQVLPFPSAEKNGSRFTGLGISLHAQDNASASEASLYLLKTYIDILILLIGESLTTAILRAAWGNESLEGFHYE